MSWNDFETRAMIAGWFQMLNNEGRSVANDCVYPNQLGIIAGPQQSTRVCLRRQQGIGIACRHYGRNSLGCIPVFCGENPCSWKGAHAWIHASCIDLPWQWSSKEKLSFLKIDNSNSDSTSATRTHKRILFYKRVPSIKLLFVEQRRKLISDGDAEISGSRLTLERRQLEGISG